MAMSIGHKTAIEGHWVRKGYFSNIKEIEKNVLNGNWLFKV